jgi:O-antigen/teichoic acid export membrane protein
MQRLLKNTLVQWIGSGLSKVIGIVFILIITRSLGSEQFGKYNLVFTFISFFTMLSSFGIYTIAIRELSKKPEDASIILGDVMVFTGAFSVFSGLLCIVISYIFGYEADILLGIKIAAIGMAISFFTAPQVIFNAKLKMEHTVVGNVIRDILLLTFALYLSRMNAGFLAYIWSSLVASMGTALYTQIVGYRLVIPKFVLDINRYEKLFKASLPLGLSGIALYIYNYVDTIMLSKMTTMAMVGYYGVAYKFVFLGQLIPNAILITLFPIFAKLNQSDKPKAQRYFQYGFDSVLLIAVFLAACGILFSRNVILLLFSPEYLPSVIPLTIFCVNFLFMFPNMLFSRYLISAGRQTEVFVFMVLSAGFNIAVNFWAIPRYGVIGAALTTAMSDIIFCALSIRALYVKEKTIMSLTQGIKMILTAAALTLLGSLLQLHWGMELFLLSMFYLFGTYLIRAFDYSSLKLLLQNI